MALKVVFRKSDMKPMPLDAPWRQDCPNHKPGIMEAAIAKRCGGTANDYIGMIVPDDQKKLVMESKYFKWDDKKEKVVGRPWRPEEIEKRDRPERKRQVESDLIDTAIRLEKAEELGLDCKTELKAKKDKLKAQLDEIKEKEKEDK